MSNRTKRSDAFSLLKQSSCFLKNNKDLIVLPIITTVFVVILVVLNRYITILDDNMIVMLKNRSDFLLKTVQFFSKAISAYVLSFIIMFFSAANVAAIIFRLRGKTCSISQGIAYACSNVSRIAAWNLFNVTISTLLRLLSGNSNILQGVTTIFVGTTWSLVTFFVIPIILFENVGSIEALKRSAKLFTGNWQKPVGITLALVTLLIPVLIILIVAAVICTVYGLSKFAIGVAIAILSFVFLMLLTTLSTIVVAALYLNLSHNEPPTAFDKDLIDRALQKA